MVLGALKRHGPNSFISYTFNLDRFHYPYLILHAVTANLQKGIEPYC